LQKVILFVRIKGKESLRSLERQCHIFQLLIKEGWGSKFVFDG